jgi:hypothetical protein
VLTNLYSAPDVMVTKAKGFGGERSTHRIDKFMNYFSQKIRWEYNVKMDVSK